MSGIGAIEPRVATIEERLPIKRSAFSVRTRRLMRNNLADHIHIPDRTCSRKVGEDEFRMFCEHLACFRGHRKIPVPVIQTGELQESVDERSVWRVWIGRRIPDERPYDRQMPLESWPTRKSIH